MSTPKPNQNSPATKPTSRRIPFAGQILRILAFWQNDRPGGLGVGIEFDPSEPTAGEEFSHELEARLASYDANANASDILAQLSAVAAESHRDPQMTASVIADIYWLQERGHLKADEYNGVAWSWIAAGTRDLATCEQNPILLDMAGLRAIDVTDIARAPGALAALQAISDYARTEPNPVTDWSYKPNRAHRRARRSRK
jgi:hypothetical protein